MPTPLIAEMKQGSPNLFKQTELMLIDWHVRGGAKQRDFAA